MACRSNDSETVSQKRLPTPGVLVTLAITPNPIPALPKGLTVDLHAMGTFSDGVENDVTDLVIWAATEPTVATVDAITTKGRVTSVATTGATNVVATFNASHGTFSDTVTVSAAPAVVVRIEIDPLTLTLPLGRADNLTCTAVYSDTTETDVTDAAAWASDFSRRESQQPHADSDAAAGEDLSARGELECRGAERQAGPGSARDPDG